MGKSKIVRVYTCWGFLLKRRTRRENFWALVKKYSPAIVLLTTVANVAFSIYNIGVIQTSQNQIAHEQQKLQVLMYNYTSHVFGYANNRLEVKTHGASLSDSPHIPFNVVIISPHSGFATVNQTFFRLYSDSPFMNQSRVILLGSYIMSVTPGSSERTFDLHFSANIYPSFGYFESRNMTGINTTLGSVGLVIIYHDVQLNKVTAFSFEIPVDINYNMF